jgi:Na+/phosphate symporter
MAETVLKRIGPGRIVLILLSLCAFVLGLTLMKEGARSLAPQIEESLDLSGIGHSLGFGWLVAMLILSGSPIGAASLTFYDAEAINERSALAMIVGSRVGAAFIVLAIGFIYVMRGRDRTRSLGVGLLSLVVSATTYLPALPLGMVLLKSGALEWATIPSDSAAYEAIKHILEPVAQTSIGLLGHLGTFFAGLAVIIVSLNLFDRALPDMEEAEEERKQLRRNLHRPWVMFIAGAAITLISLSVTISLSILVPLSQHRIVKQKTIVPYIMGANITTLVDTLFAAAVMDNPEAVSIVLAGLGGIIFVSIMILVAVYRRYENIMLAVSEWVMGSRRNLAIFMSILALVPLVLLLA